MSGQSREYNILLVEDTLDFARLVQATLKRIGLELFHTPTGEEAVEYLEHTRPDLVLLDLNLPGITGWDVLEHLAQLYDEETIPIIVTSAYSDDANRLLAESFSVFQYLVKPFPPGELIQAVQEALSAE